MNKKLQFLILFLSLGIYTVIFAQTQQSNFINYQGVASNTAGDVMGEETITVGIMLKRATTGAASYAENHTVTTDTNGVFSLKIGNGDATTGTYENYQWGGSVATFLTVFINGTEIGTTELLAVPFALSSGDSQWRTSNDGSIFNRNGGNVRIGANLEVGSGIKLENGVSVSEISTDGTLASNSDKAIPTEKAVKMYVDANGGSGLEKITEKNGDVENTGWRLKGTEPADYGPIGKNAIDMSISDINGDFGASGNYSTAMGLHTRAFGYYSVATGLLTSATGDLSNAMGSRTLASGRLSTAMGISTKAESSHSLVIGRYNIGGFTDNGGASNGDKNWIAEDPLFEIGNGSKLGPTIAPHNALTVLKNGNIGIDIAKPKVKLHITGGNDTALGDDAGYMVIGAINSQNIVMDGNEILARNNGSTSGLHLQYDGGSVVVGGDVVHSSDKRLKKDITDLSYGLEEVLQLRPVSYYWKNREQQHKSLGLIAQEVQPIIKELVHTDSDKDKTLSLSYTELVPILIKAVQEQQTIIDGQKINITQLSAEVNNSKKDLANLLTRVIAMEKEKMAKN